MVPPLVQGPMSRGLEHRLTKPNHPWTNGPPLGDCRQSPAGQRVERMNRTIKEATVKRFHYDSHDQLRPHLADFLLRRGNSPLDCCLFPPHLQLRPKAQDAEWPHALRIHLQNPDIRAGTIHPKPDPPDAGTEHLEKVLLAPFRSLLEFVHQLRQCP